MTKIDKDTFCKTCEKYGFFKQIVGEDIYYKLKRDAEHYICKRRSSSGTIYVTLGTELIDGEFVTEESSYIISDVKTIDDFEDFIELALKRYKRFLREQKCNSINSDFV